MMGQVTQSGLSVAELMSVSVTSGCLGMATVVKVEMFEADLAHHEAFDTK